MSSTIAARWDRVQGDIGDSIVAKLNGVSDLTSVTHIEGHINNERHPTVSILSASVLDATARTVRVMLGNAGVGWLPTLDLLGLEEDEFELHLELQFVDGTELTWPERGFAVIHVTAQKG